MPKLEDRLEKLRRSQNASSAAGSVDEALAALRKALRDKANLMVAEAAKLAARLKHTMLVPDLLAAFDRLFQNPVKTDSKCWGKTAIAKALTDLDYRESPPYLRGAGHRQMEPVWGGQEDSAIHLRALCVLSLVQCDDLSRAEIMRQLIDAITDPADPVRLEAIRAMEQMGGEEPALLLRLKARLGDTRPVVTGQVFDALLNLEPAAAVNFVGHFLHDESPAVRDEAALALGGSRSLDAVRLLIDACAQEGSRDFFGVLLRALSASRQPAAIDFLLEIVKSGTSRNAALSLDALKLHDSAEIQARVEQAKRERS